MKTMEDLKEEVTKCTRRLKYAKTHNDVAVDKDIIKAIETRVVKKRFVLKRMVKQVRFFCQMKTISDEVKKEVMKVLGKVKFNDESIFGYASGTLDVKVDLKKKKGYAESAGIRKHFCPPPSPQKHYFRVKTPSYSSSSYVQIQEEKKYIFGPRGGKYYITEKGNSQYVGHHSNYDTKYS